MVLNKNIPLELEMLMKEEHVTLEDIGNKLGTSKQCAWNFRKNAKVNNNLVRVAEAIGYDVEVRFVKRDN